MSVPLLSSFDWPIEKILSLPDEELGLIAYRVLQQVTDSPHSRHCLERLVSLPEPAFHHVSLRCLDDVSCSGAVSIQRFREHPAEKRANLCVHEINRLAQLNHSQESQLFQHHQLTASVLVALCHAVESGL